MLLPFLLSTLALALDADTFDLAGSAIDQRTGLQVLDPHVGWPGSRYAGLVVGYANDPVVRVWSDGAEDTVVSDAFATHLVGGLGIGGVVRLDAALPLYPFVAGTDRAAPALGDLRVAGTVPLWNGPMGAAVAIAPQLSLPTGTRAAYTGAGATSAALTVAGGLRPLSALALNVNLGVVAQPGARLGDTRVGPGASVGLGGAYRVAELVRVGAELDGMLTFGSDWRANPWELHAFGVLGEDHGLGGIVGIGTGLVAGVGAPDARVLAGIHWRAPGEEPVHDADGDGIDDRMDGCKDAPEDVDGFQDADGCPDLDDDGDRLPDADDRCPREPEDADGFEDGDGCPEADDDRDGDGLLDADDSCPTEVGPAEARGCPDVDADRVPDRLDSCPQEARDPREDPARSDGCPKRVVVTLERIEIAERIHFDTGRTTIHPQSDPLLEDIAKALRDNPDILRVEVAGHTDNVGSDAANQKLSQGRAEAVVVWLSTRGGVDASRLYAVGYGESEPLETNATEAGRGINRRVEFRIKETDPTRAPTLPDVPDSPQ